MPLLVRGLLAWFAWACFGLFVGWHWLVLYFAVARTSPERKRCMLHFVLYLIALFGTAAGGGYVRSGNHVSCANSTGSMGRDCLWDLQETDYQIVYVLHYITLGWMAVSWVYDAAQLPGWLSQASKKQPLAVCYSSWSLTTAAYLLLTAFGVFWVTLTWAAFVNWETENNGLRRLLGYLALVGAICGLAGCGGMHVAKAPRDTEEAGL